MIHLILSVLCSTIIFVVFRIFTHFKVNNLQAIVVNYLVAGTLGWFPLFGFSAAPDGLTSWGLWPLAIGLLFIILFQLMATVTQKSGVGVVGVTVKMSLVIPVIAGVMLYGDTLGAGRITGIVMALMAVWLINARYAGKVKSSIHPVWPVILFVGSGVLDALIKYAQHTSVGHESVAQFTGTSFMVAGVLGIAYLAHRVLILRRDRLQIQAIPAGLLLGIPNFGSIYFLIRALEQPGQDSAVVFPINNLGVVGLSALVGILLFSESFDIRKRWGLVLAVLAIALLAITT